ncbi:PH domain leucine-rich repeat-containing protein phosphatase 2-like isoform X2 [Mercenaria mercenaria]|uniref:PH domain leucine-rich repeat-containing protein phosphatase 2-like isoform X2 n=1 Tax=Mercenaria mercenaria TaxID=6596 RepID=UPI00234EAA7C|nr:PH domain leucine-rich repeat-containing protein phosphatase 2-like isoform X2 [Mercenaria mercenaria]
MKDCTVAMDTGMDYDRKGLVVPCKRNMVFKMSLLPIRDSKATSVEIEMPAGSSSETVGNHSAYSHGSSNSHSTAKSRMSRGTDAWWSVRDFIQPEISNPHSVSFSKANDDDTWDLSDSIVDLYKEVDKYDGVHIQSPTNRNAKVDVQEWIQEDTSNGFVHVFKSDTDRNPRMFPCTLTTTAQKLCIQCGMPPNSLHVQFNGDIIRRLDQFDSPLAIQNEYLQNIGYTDQRKIQDVGAMEDLEYLVKFYAGKPVSDSTYSRNQLSTFAYVRKGKLLYQWVRRLCVITGTRLLIYRDKTKSGSPTIVQLAKGTVEEVQSIKGHDHVLKLTSTLQGERSVYLSFTDEKDYNKWRRKTKKATAKLPTKADLSNCHLEFLPETVFINDELEILNLRHNVLKERPIEEDIYTIGWLDDLPRFTHLRSLNLADNDLRCFPMSVCKMRTLTELNLASNKIEDIPPDIVDLENLQMLHLHNNHLNYLPDEMCRMRNLLVIVLAFNHFTSVPNVLLQTHESLLRIDSLIMAGNRIEKLSQDVLNKIQHIKKIDFRLNKLTLSPSEMAKFHLLELVTHLDVRDNAITDLDVRSLRKLEYLNCERNKLHSLQVSGGAIKLLFAMQNEISSISISPKPEWLTTLDVSKNKCESLPSWISDCFFLVQLNASHNLIKKLPDKLLVDTPKLRVLKLSHNLLTELPSEVKHSVLEDLSLEHNQLSHLPKDLFVNLPKLRYICLTNNLLETVPEPNHNVYQNKVQELYLSANRLGDDVIHRITLFHKVKVLHLAYNQITEIHDRDLRKLENIQELNISGNFLRHLPKCVGRHSKLQAVRCNANLLKELPDFRYSPNLKVLEVGSNRLMDVSVTSLMASNVNLLDISGNPEMQVSSVELKGIKTKKKVCMVDIKGQNRSLLDLRTAGFDDLDIPWQSGLSQTSGMRNKLSVSIVNRPKFNEGQEGLFALFDGGRNDEVTRILSNRIVAVMEEEYKHPVTGPEYLKYTLLAAHRKLKSTGQKVGAAGAICHLHKHPSGNSPYVLNVANVGDVEVVICRRGEASVLSKLFSVSSNKEEMERICKSGGIVTEDNKINGVTQNTRLLGSSYLFPYVVPDPHVTTTTLQPDDQLIIIANQGLWKYMSYQETVNEIIDIPDPVLAAKKLQDLAQGYLSQENIGVLVIRLMLSQSERNKMRQMLQTQFENEQKLLAELRVRDIEREEQRKRAELEEQNDGVPMDIVKLKGGKKRKQVDRVFSNDPNEIDDSADEHDGVKVRPLPRYHHRDKEDPATNWELMLQKRLTEEVKDKELIHAMRVQEYDPYFPAVDSDENWSATTKLKGQVKERTVTLPPKDDFGNFMTSPSQTHPPAPHLPRRQIIPEASQISTESLEFKRELKHPLNVDRDAILFHNMQLSRHKSHNMSSNSIDSIQSDPAYASVKEMMKDKKSSSHSIEVLLHGPTAQHAKTETFGGSHKLPKQESELPNRNSQVDSCPTDMNDRLKMLEQKGFLPKENENGSKTKEKDVDRRLTAEDIERNFGQSNESCDSTNTIIDVNDIENTERKDILDENDTEFISDYETIVDITAKHKHDTDEEGEIMIMGEIYSANGHDSGIRDTEHLNWWNGRKSNSAEGLPEKERDKDEDLTELYATVRKVKKQNNEKNVVDEDIQVKNASLKKSEYEADEVNQTRDILVDRLCDNISKDTTEDRSETEEKKVVTVKPYGNMRTPPPVPKKNLIGETEESGDSVTEVCPESKSPSAVKKTAPKVNGLQRNSPEIRHKDVSYVNRYQLKANFVQQQRQKFAKSPLTVTDVDADENRPTKVDHVEHRVKNSKSPMPFKNTNEEKQTSNDSNDHVKSDIGHSTKTKRAPAPDSKVEANHFSTDDDHLTSEHKKRPPPPVPPRVPIKHPPMHEPDINSNSIKSLEDLIAYNRLQQQKVSYKGTAKVAPPPPPKVPETSMVTKTSSQRSIIITYL